VCLKRKDRRPGRPGISPVLASAIPSTSCLIGVPEEEGQEAGEARHQPCVGLCYTLRLLKLAEQQNKQKVKINFVTKV
jgi:hypothetical protein